MITSRIILYITVDLIRSKKWTYFKKLLAGSCSDSKNLIINTANRFIQHPQKKKKNDNAIAKYTYVLKYNRSCMIKIVNLKLM